MRIDRGGGINYPEVQNMIPRQKRAEDAAAAEASVTEGIVRAFWGYSYEIPGFFETGIFDPGDSEGGFGFFWETILPSTTIVDRVTFARVDPLASPSGPMGFAIYRLGFDQHDLVVRTVPFDASEIADGIRTKELTERTEIPPGVYAVSLIAPCFDMLCIRHNVDCWSLANNLETSESSVTTRGQVPRYGTFLIAPGWDDVFPDPIDPSIIYVPSPLGEFDLPGACPVTYFDDSEEGE